MLMCAPTHFRVAYEINPWMHLGVQVDRQLAFEQWHALTGTLRGLGVTVDVVAQDEYLPDMVFTANAGVALGNRFIPARFSVPQRKPEAYAFASWFAGYGYEVSWLDLDVTWEGEGDLLFSDGQAFGGYGFRSDLAGLRNVGRLLGINVEPLELVDPRYYHLDTCLCPLGDGRALYYPPAFSGEARAEIERRFDDLIAVSDAEAALFACNAVVIGDTVVMNVGCPETAAALAARELPTVFVDVGEFLKAGGSVRCLTLALHDGRN
jgi:N-dimethylarginine dimethylaminohydrolase